ncbi:MAG: LysR family transcriptional regulator [Pigmentiphaga sp.]|nr:LysR family transcriptional regulator [Pigmentiphaga sp.]
MSGPSFPQFSTNELSMRSIRKLRLHQLQVVDSILQTGSFVQAAQQLGMTQSAITKAVQELEAFFDGQLFVRSRRGAQATELGAQLGGHIRPILRKVQDMADALNDYRLGESGSLVVGVLSTASSDRFTEAVRLLHQQYPRINISVLVGTAASCMPICSADGSTSSSAVCQGCKSPCRPSWRRCPCMRIRWP